MPTRPPRHAPRAWRPTPGREQRPAPRKHSHRGTTAERGYGGAWQRARKGYLAHHPLCVHCLADGTVTAASVVDHIVPHRGDQTLFWDHDNWQALCKACHDRKTATEDGGFGNDRIERDGQPT